MAEDLSNLPGQWFPLIYGMGSVDFADADGEPSGAQGARATLTKSIPNFPVLFLGIRLTNIYALPEEPTDTQIRIFEACKRYVDDEQSVKVSLSQQNITTDSVLQVQLVGKSGVYWAPFPVPFPMAGANDIQIEVIRDTSYPFFDQAVPILPKLKGSLAMAQFRPGAQTMPPIRVGRYS